MAKVFSAAATFNLVKCTFFQCTSITSVEMIRDFEAFYERVMDYMGISIFYDIIASTND